MKIGDDRWREYVRVLRAAMALDGPGNRPRGADQVGAVPMPGESMLPGEWGDKVFWATHVIYHHATPIAWIDGSGGEWVVPGVSYGPQTSAAQKRIRAALEHYSS
jgi:hypothetical protein